MATISSFLSGLFKKQSDSVLGVDIGSSSIKVVQLRKHGAKAILETYGELALGPYAGVEIGRATNLPQEKVIEALKDVLREANTGTKACGFSIPASSSLLSFIKMPNVDQKQLAAMIPLEARKYIPVPISEVMLDWTIVPREETSVSDFEKKPEDKKAEEGIGTVDVLLAVIHNDIITKFSQIVETAQLEASLFEIEIFSSMRSVLEQSLDAQMVFDMGAGSTKLYIIERGTLKASHTVNRGSQEITLALSRALGLPVGEAEHMKRTVGLSQDEKYKNMKDIITLNLDYIFSETNRVILNYQKKYNRSISRVVLTGGGALLKGLLDLARNHFQTEVVLGDPFSKTEAPAFLENILKNAGPEFAVAIGLALKQLQDK
jgi:type IV pilus assembly protein PilM